MSDDENADMEEWEDPLVIPPAKSIFTDFVGPPQEVFQHMIDNNGFDLLKTKTELGLDQYGCIQMINYLRTLINKGAAVPAKLNTEDFLKDEYYAPVLDNDSLLQYDYEDEMEETQQQTQENTTQKCKQLEGELTELKREFEMYRKLTERDTLGGFSADELRTDAAKVKVKSVAKEDSDPYFSSYAHFGIHEEMLKDEVRTLSYQNAMYKNKTLFANKVVLDVGCGSGILSMMAAKAGASLVIGVDNSEIIETTKKIIQRNGLSEKITLIRGKVEEITLPVEKVDIIISEWMGYFLLFESMLDSVIFARDKWLTPNGTVLPDRCTMHVEMLSDNKRYNEKVNFWDSVYGFDMTPMREHVLDEVDIAVANPESVCSEASTINDIDISSAVVDKLEFSAPFSLKSTKAGRIEGLLVYFDTFFAKNCENKIEFSTGPHATPTHWKQTIFYFKKTVQLNEGEVLTGKLDAKRSKDNIRHWTVKLSYSGPGGEQFTQDYSI
eukprot:m.16820 g.16820  ORF g.16820 m.16820 type:complete len:496 (+) comp5813_c0_seq1:39-1526(+)